jgi:hypothetical protein
VKRRVVLALGLALVLLDDVARADDAVCLSTYVDAQRVRKDGQLVEARRQLVMCSQDDCPAKLRKECVAWLAEIEEAIPSVAVQVRGPDGCDRGDAIASLDGVPLPSDGRAVDVNPGAHVLRVELAGAVQTQSVVATVGDRNRVVRVSYADAAVTCGSPRGGPPPSPLLTPATPEAPRRIPTLAYVLGGAGLAALGLSAGFGVSAWNQKGTLDDCKGSCAPRDVDTMRRTFLVADVSAGIGIAALAAATIIVLLH